MTSARRPARLYGPDQAGGLCESCDLPMVAHLTDRTHPACDPTHAELADAFRRASRLRKTR